MGKWPLSRIIVQAPQFPHVLKQLLILMNSFEELVLLLVHLNLALRGYSFCHLPAPA